MPVLTSGESPEKIAEDAVYRIGKAIVRVTDNDISFNEEPGTYTGSVTVKNIGHGLPVFVDSSPDQKTATISGDELFHRIIEHEIWELPSRVQNEPRKVIREFAEQELSNYCQTCNQSQQYNGVNGVEDLGDIDLALAIVANQIGHADAGESGSPEVTA